MSQPLQDATAPLELWGGVECTVSRVGDAYHAQLARTGHLDRPGDIDRIADLGVRAVRYPVLWEQHAPDGEDARGEVDWGWADARLGRLRERGVRPIVGLVHHGSGPRHTSLVDPGFAPGLARYAELVAERYPWVAEWTPVNEPLTTARFSGLYGVWYPHGYSPRTFARALVTQCEAVRLAMRAIRRVNPDARLVQTDDLGRVYGTPDLAGEVALRNERRWLAFDLLAGRVDAAHPFWPLLRRWGIRQPELEAFLAEPCPPDVVGINHYPLSDRFLDSVLARHPERPRERGVVCDVRFADVEAVRAHAPAALDVAARLREAWERYRRPVAVTEAHIGCTHEEQMRWLADAWQGAQALRREGADVRAVTVWSLFGAYDWNTCVTRDQGYYEPGAFDVRAPAPRPTGLAGLARQLARGEAPDHPLLGRAHRGWWRRPERLWGWAVEEAERAGAPAALQVAPRGAAGTPARPLLVTGGTGTLGSAFVRLCAERGIPCVAPTRRELDVADARAVREAVDGLRPWAVVNCAGWVRVDDAEAEPEACMRANADGPAVLAEACARAGARLVAFSSDLVFDGAFGAPPGDAWRGGPLTDALPRPYVERDPPAPLGVYGRSKAEMEARVLEALPEALVVRTSAFFGPWDAHNFVTAALRALAAGEPFAAACDAVVSPTYVPDLVHAALDLLVDGEGGVWHLANPGAVTWAELARGAAAMAGVPADTLVVRPTEAFGLAAPRPPYAVLGSERGWTMPPLEHALARYLRDGPRFAPAPRRRVLAAR